MTTDAHSLMTLYKGWEDYQISLVRAIAPLSREQLAWRPAPHLRSGGEIASHIIGGRIQWFHSILGAGSAEFASQVAAWRPEDAIEEKPAELVRWLEATWQMIEEALTSWNVADLAQTYHLPYQGENYALTRQWIIWRVSSHDLHHGGELAVTLGVQGIALPELGDEGGHLAERAPLAE
ncbi:MAG: DinB family protein [Ktedonobacteraceae bacterium]